MASTRINTLLLGLGAMLASTLLVATAFGAMRSERLGPGLCETTGGARYVDLPGFPGELIDRRLLRDVRLLERRYRIFVTDGYSADPVHAANGEHPIGLALDIVPNVAAGGTWRDVTALARWAEPSPDQPIAPFRWVGYDGDAGHGRGHHLHLSWNHSETRPGVSPTTVYSLRCPTARAPRGDGAPAVPTGSAAADDGGGGGRRDGDNGRDDSHSGGVAPGSGGPSGGVGFGRIATSPPVVEAGGIDLR